jgi:antitoxin (DNA-binding transcriptional repressor) of toxin-antitoxin stability system
MSPAMKTVNIADLKNRLSAYLQLVRNGEELLVKDRDIPVAHISPYRTGDLGEEERQLVAAGILKAPSKSIRNWDKFWDDFWAIPGAKVSEKRAMQAVLDEREEGR